MVSLLGFSFVEKIWMGVMIVGLFGCVNFDYLILSNCRLLTQGVSLSNVRAGHLQVPK